MIERTTYLGDGVYCKFDGYAYSIYLDDGYHAYSNIILEPEIVDAFINFTKLIKKENSHASRTK